MLRRSRWFVGAAALLRVVGFLCQPNLHWIPPHPGPLPLGEEVVDALALLGAEFQVDADHAVAQGAQGFGVAVASGDLFHEFGGGNAGFGFQ